MASEAGGTMNVGGRADGLPGTPSIYPAVFNLRKWSRGNGAIASRGPLVTRRRDDDVMMMRADADSETASLW